jgi:Na+-transporting NADH:ubiquinone oxidoreductase subunit NqrB
LCLGLPPDDAAVFRASTVFTGPAGLACKVAWQSADGASGARPEVLLPLPADGLAGPGVRRLLTVQALLLSEFGWYLGCSSHDEGLLQITPLLWMNRPADVAAALDVGNLLGAVVLDRMGQPPDAAGSAGA